MNTTKQGKTLRMLMPQWQGGDYDLSVPTGELYPLGARMLAWLAPKSDAPLVEVPVEPFTGAPRTTQNGVVRQDVVLRQLRAARKVIDEHRPDRIVMFGGDCLVSQAPFAYLNEIYEGKVGILWIDTHPDISTPGMHDREHAMVLGNLLGQGDPLFAKEVKRPFKVDQVLIIGVDSCRKAEEEAVRQMNLRLVPTTDVIAGGNSILHWVRENKFEKIAVHFDLDVLDPKSFYSQLPMDPGGASFPVTPGKLTIPQVTKLVQDVSATADVVGLSFAEHMPWDARNLKRMMEDLPIMK